MEKKGVFLESIENFSKQTSVHGLNIVGLPKLHYLERLFWVLICTFAGIGAIAIAYSNWMRYQANPTVVSLEKDFRNWKNFFPAVTGCFMQKADPEKTKLLIQELWGVDETNAKFDYYQHFIRTLANTTYSNLNELAQFENDAEFKNLDFFQTVVQVHPKLSGTLVTFDTKRKTIWTLVMTEMGLCFTVNSKFINFLSVNYKIGSKDVFSDNILRCHYLNGLCYARYDSDPLLPLKYYVHSYLDVVHIASEDAPLVVHESEEVEINYRMQETESAPALRDLSPAQRRCRFYDEPLTDQVPIYSTSILFYLEGKSCNLNGLLCLAKYEKNLTESPTAMGCKCPQPCDLVVYFPQVSKLTRWENGYFDQRITFRWALLPPTTKYHRDILFGFEDLVVSFGGTLALFLGFSFISGIETIFLLVENLYLFCIKRRRNNRKKIIHVKTLHNF